MQRNSASDPLIKQSEEILQQSRNMNKKGQSLQALILADQALETFLRACCLRLGCTDETTLTVSKDKEKNFKTWGMTEYLKWLGEKKSLGKKEKSDFFTFHNWRNQAQHSGLIPSPTQVSEVSARALNYPHTVKYYRDSSGKGQNFAPRYLEERTIRNEEEFFCFLEDLNLVSALLG